MVVLSIFSGIFFYVNNTSFFFFANYFFLFYIFIFHINIVSFIFFYYRQSKPPFCLHYVKCSPVNIVSRKINWQKPASISAYQINRKSLSMKNFLKIVSVYVGVFFSSARTCGLYLIVIQICLYLYTEYGMSY